MNFQISNLLESDWGRLKCTVLFSRWITVCVKKSDSNKKKKKGKERVFSLHLHLLSLGLNSSSPSRCPGLASEYYIDFCCKTPEAVSSLPASSYWMCHLTNPKEDFFFCPVFLPQFVKWALMSADPRRQLPRNLLPSGIVCSLEQRSIKCINSFMCNPKILKWSENSYNIQSFKLTFWEENTFQIYWVRISGLGLRSRRM